MGSHRMPKGRHRRSWSTDTQAPGCALVVGALALGAMLGVGTGIATLTAILL